MYHDRSGLIKGAYIFFVILILILCVSVSAHEDKPELLGAKTSKGDVEEKKESVAQLCSKRLLKNEDNEKMFSLKNPVERRLRFVAGATKPQPEPPPDNDGKTPPRRRRQAVVN